MSSRRLLRKKSCDGKVPYPTRAEATKALEEMIRRLGRRGRLNVYPCKFGTHFHVGHKPRFRKRGRR